MDEDKTLIEEKKKILLCAVGKIIHKKRQLIKKGINRFSFEEKLKQRVYSKEIAPRRKRGYSVNRKELMKNFLIDKYGKEMFSQIEGIANSKEMNYSKKEKKIIELIGSEEFRKTEKYLRYITEL